MIFLQITDGSVISVSFKYYFSLELAAFQFTFQAVASVTILLFFIVSLGVTLCYYSEEDS